MNISYSVNLVIFGLDFNPRSEFNIGEIFERVSIFDDSVVCYRGTITCKRKYYTIKLTRNGYCTVYLRKDFARILINIRFLVLDILDFIQVYCESDLLSVTIFPRNIQITFQIIFDKEVRFVDFCLKIVETFSSKYNFEIKESNSSDSVWVIFTERNSYFSNFRLKIKGDVKLVFTILYTFKGSCLTCNVSQYIDICEDLKFCYCKYYLCQDC